MVGGSRVNKTPGRRPFDSQADAAPGLPLNWGRKFIWKDDDAWRIDYQPVTNWKGHLPLFCQCLI